MYVERVGNLIALSGAELGSNRMFDAVKINDKYKIRDKRKKEWNEIPSQPPAQFTKQTRTEQCAAPCQVLRIGCKIH